MYILLGESVIINIEDIKIFLLYLLTGFGMELVRVLYYEEYMIIFKANNLEQVVRYIKRLL